MKNFKALLIIPLSIWLLSSCTNKKYIHTLWLDEIPYGIIINPYGLPVKNLSHNKDSIEINGVRFQRGIGTHVPSDFTINLDGRPVIFEAMTGLNGKNQLNKEEFTAGAVFKVYADDKLVYTTVHTELNSPSRKVRLRLKDVQNIRLVTSYTGSEEVPVYANWAMARFRFRNEIHPFSFHMFSFPEEILHNQAGYKPKSHKVCILPFHRVDSLYVHDYQTNEIVYRNTIDLKSGDLGKYISADFSGLTTPGEYYLMSAGSRTGRFVIDSDIYKTLLASHLEYLNLRRSRGYHFTRDATSDIAENRQQKNLQYSNAKPEEIFHSLSLTFYSLSVFYEYSQDSSIRESISTEMRYINQILSDIIGENKNNSKSGFSEMDDLTAYFIYAAASARFSRLTGGTFTLYSGQEMIEDFFSNRRQDFQKDPYHLGAAIICATELYNSTNRAYYKQLAENYVRGLIDMAVKSDEKPHGFFKNSAINPAYDKMAAGTPNWPLAGLCIYTMNFPDNKTTEDCRTAIQNYCESYLSFIAGKSAFRIVPYSIYTQNPGLSRRSGSFFYRYSGLENDPEKYWRGTNTHITSTAAGLIMASRILDKPEYIKLAQRQFDWVYGSNPFNTSMVAGWGNINPKACFTRHDSHCSPLFKGGVTSGIWGDDYDAPAIFPGWPQTSQSYLPALAGTIWLTTLLDSFGNSIQ